MRISREHRNLCGQVVHDLGLRILSGQVRPGESLPQEWALCDELGVSRTVVREAIKSLAAKGLVESRAKRGTIVRPVCDWNFLDPEVLAWQAGTDPDGRYLFHLTEFRQIFEPAAAAMAAERASDEHLAQIRSAFEEMEQAADSVADFLEADKRFHVAILNATGNPLFGPVANVISTSLENSLRVTNRQAADNQASLPIHRKVLNAISNRCAPEAEQAMLALLDEAGARIRRAVEANAETGSAD
ncbi:FadR/GntR family transcriptional regulator [Thermostilla marina]